MLPRRESAKCFSWARKIRCNVCRGSEFKWKKWIKAFIAQQKWKTVTKKKPRLKAPMMKLITKYGRRSDACRKVFFLVLTSSELDVNHLNHYDALPLWNSAIGFRLHHQKPFRSNIYPHCRVAVVKSSVNHISNLFSIVLRLRLAANQLLWSSRAAQATWLQFSNLHKIDLFRGIKLMMAFWLQLMCETSVSCWYLESVQLT